MPIAKIEAVRRALIALAVLTLTLVACAFSAGEVLSVPARRVVGLPPPELAAEVVVLSVSSSESVSGWFSRGTPGLGAVLLLHGVRSNRRQMVQRAKFLHAAGYSVLLIDLPAHGESDGARITFGYREAAGASAAMQFLKRTLPGERTAVIGVSLGAASFVLAGGSVTPNAVVLESMYPTLTEAVSDRLTIRMGAFGAQLAPILLWQLPIRLGFTADQVRPIDRLAALQAPVLVAAGMMDRHTTVAETKRLYEAAREPKELWLVAGAAHQDLHAFDPATYEARISAFLLRYLR